MDLKDQVKRPVFNADKIDRNHPAFVKFVNQYISWVNSAEKISGDEKLPYENEIISCFKEHDLDGYNLAKHIYDITGMDPDAWLVEILDGAESVKRIMYNDILKQWIKENFLTIPKDCIGKKVNAKQNYSEYKNLYITGISHDTYQVNICPNWDRLGCGYLINFENIEFVNETNDV